MKFGVKSGLRTTAGLAGLVLSGLAVSGLVFSGGAAAEPTSAYTSLNQKTCKTIDKAKDGDGEWTISRCGGRHGWQVFIDYDDARDQLRLARSGKEFRLNHGVATFNSLGPRIEWRMAAAGAPAYALIYRVRWKDQATNKQRSRLVVVRLSKAGACRMGSVDSHMTEMNRRARRLADNSARGFVCGRDKPVEVR